MIKLTTKEDVALLVEEASEMFEETGCVPDLDGKKVRAEKIVPRAKRYILETIDNPKASYDATIWHSPGYTLVLSWLSQKWLKYCQKLAPIPRSRDDPKILGRDDAEVVGDRVAEVRPIARNLFAQETERRVGELRAGCIAFVVRNVSVHQAP
jgi:hypothetical protein